ncbi:hypothetical protein [Lysobacter gummosus]
MGSKRKGRGCGLFVGWSKSPCPLFQREPIAANPHGMREGR